MKISSIAPVVDFIRKRQKLSTIIALVILVVAIITGRSLTQRLKQPEVGTVQVTRMNLRKSVEVSGKVQAEEAVNLHFQTFGKLAWIGVKEGDRVKRWQAVASQDTRTLEKQLRQDLIAFEQEFRDFSQAVGDNPLVNDRFKRILEKAQFDLDNEVIDVEIRNLAIELATLVSPIEGIVTRVDTPVAGVNTTTADTIQVVNPGSLYFVAEVDESDVGLIAPGQQATIVLDAFADEIVESDVVRIDFTASISEGGGTVFLVNLSLGEQGERGYRLGMSGDASIAVAEKEDVLAIPFETIIQRNGVFSVEVVDKQNKVQQKAIETGLVTAQHVEVLSGLTEGDRVVLPQ